MTKLVVRPDLAPWEKRKGESAKAFEAFALFRDLGATRSLPKVAQALAKSVPLIKRWSSAHDWAERVAEYDLHMERVRQEAAEDELAAQKTREMAASAAAASLVIRRLAGDPKDKTVKAIHPNELDPGDVARLGDFFVRTGRLSLGQPTDVVKGGLAINPAEVARIVQAIVGLGLRWMTMDVPPAAMMEGFVRDVEALGGAA